MNAARWTSAALCLFACLAAPAQTVPKPAPVVHAASAAGKTTHLGREIATLLTDPAVSRAHWGIAVTTLDGKPLYGLDEGQLFRPASTAKLFTTTAAMALLGPDATVTTTVYCKQPAPDGTVTGDLTIVGYGDANLSGRDFPYTAAASKTPVADPLREFDEFAAKVSAAGVKHISGNIIGSNWPWEPYPQGWNTDDLMWGYGAPVTSLAVDDNAVLLTVSPGVVDEVEQSITLTPDVGYYRIGHSFIRTGDARSTTSVAVYRDPGDRTLQVVGRVAAGRPYTTHLAIDDPPLYAAYALLAMLKKHGVVVDGEPKASHDFIGNPDNFLRESEAPLLPPNAAVGYGIGGCSGACSGLVKVEHTSPTLAQDVVFTLKESQNLHAEMMLRRLAKKSNVIFLDQSSSTFAQGARVVRQWLINAGLDGDDFVFYDGSGLSTKDLVTPRAEAQLLAFAVKQPWFAVWKAALPVGGVDGTLEHRFTEAPLKGHVFAKTGTMGESRALAGYVDCASGKQVIFSILVDNHTPGSPADRTVMDKIVAAIAADN
jgi:D-alanyl-D-alanine carboxypeptidase/D-alanyl-D-alanine-endopeptidase (penicillin-binding protein 4)